MIVTFCLYLLFEKLPSIKDPELKASELDQFVQKMGSKAKIPEVFMVALNAAVGRQVEPPTGGAGKRGAGPSASK